MKRLPINMKIPAAIPPNIRPVKTSPKSISIKIQEDIPF